MSDIAKSFGTEYTQNIKLKVVGTSEMNTAKTAVKEMQLSITPEEFLHIWREKVKIALQKPPLMPGR